MTEKTTGVPPDSAPEPPDGFWHRLHARLHRNPLTSLITKVVVGFFGSVILIGGVIMIVTPGPALVLIPLGLAILSTEFQWAHNLLDKTREKAREAKARSEAMDPRVRRRRRLLSLLAFVVVAGAVTAYLILYDWPTLALDGWDWVQGIAGWVPDLPGM